MADDKEESSKAPESASSQSLPDAAGSDRPQFEPSPKPAACPATGDDKASGSDNAVAASAPSPEDAAVSADLATPVGASDTASSRPREPSGGSAGRRVYQAGTMRKTFLSFVFLLLLPFFASVPAMVYQRATHQLWTDVLGFAVFAAAFAFIMLLVTFELIYSIRSRVEIGESAVRLILPAARGVAMPKFFYRKQEVPYSAIDMVETRREVYGGRLAPVMLRGARIVTKTGDKIPLGYVSEANVDPVLPVPEIASEIAKRTGGELIDRGTVHRKVHKKLRGVKADDGAGEVSDAEIAQLNRRHNNVMLALCAVLFLLVAGGLMLDISKSNLDLGERANQQTLTKSSPQARTR